MFTERYLKLLLVFLANGSLGLDFQIMDVQKSLAIPTFIGKIKPNTQYFPKHFGMKKLKTTIFIKNLDFIFRFLN